MSNYNDIFKYFFEKLYCQVKDILGREVFNQSFEDSDPFTEKYLARSVSLFDIAGDDFKWHKACEADYRYWVEVYILKMIECLLKRAGVSFEEHYHTNSLEQYSIELRINNQLTEVYFLYDIMFNESNATDYDLLAKALKANSQDADKINIYIFRNSIEPTDLAWLVNVNSEKNENGMVEVFPIKVFFEQLFDDGVYDEFLEKAKSFHEKCNSTISYKTVILPTKRSLQSFRLIKMQLLEEMDYKKLAANIQNEFNNYLKDKIEALSDFDFNIVLNSYKKNKMYQALTSRNDFADSFISAEWAYDVFRNAMGELELTGIVAGYLKSIEQMLYKVARFHINEDLLIDSKEGGQVQYTYDNEELIDSTLNSLSKFVTAYKTKLGLTKNIRVYISNVISLWRKYERNNLFHKDNLYKKDNKIGIVRDSTIFLYFLILGGLKFTGEEIAELGVSEIKDNQNELTFGNEVYYRQFKIWFQQMFKYDLPDQVPGMDLMLVHDDRSWTVKVVLLKYFYIEEYESSDFNLLNSIETNHLRELPDFTWQMKENNARAAVNVIQNWIKNYQAENEESFERINAILVTTSGESQLAWFKE